MVKTLEEIYQSLLRGDLSCINEDTRMLINGVTVGLLDCNNPTTTQIYQMELILKISNAIYNNASDMYCPLEDGVYDLLIEKFRKYNNDQYPVGAPPIQFGVSNKLEVAPELVKMYHRIDDSESLFMDDIRTVNDSIRYSDSFLRSMYVRVNNISISKRNRNTAHDHPELVGTLDKCKFVLSKQAKDRGVYDDPTVRIFERDFLYKNNSRMGINITDNIDLVAELKYDGISIEAEVTDRIVSARTRGDTTNDLAADLTPILEGYRFRRALPIKEPIGMKFEAILTYENLRKLSMLKGKEYANCRNALAAIVGSRDGRRYRDLITLVPLAVDNSVIKKLDMKIREEEIWFLNAYYANDVYLSYSSIHGPYVQALYQVKKFVDEAEYLRDKLQFMYDGVVVSYSDMDIRNILGRENSVNKWTVAIKFNPMKKNTIFTGYTYTVGQNGNVTPMIHYLPVEFYGTIHTKSSGHSFKRFKELDLAIGDIITVEYRNDVMPYVSKPDIPENEHNPREPEKIITQCPFCGSTLEVTDSGKTLKCPNLECPERVTMRITNFLAKIGVKDFSEATVRALGIKHIEDLFFTEIEYSTVEELIGPNNALNFIKQINDISRTPTWDYVLVGALGFTGIAAAKWKMIFQYITLNDLINCKSSELYNRLSNVHGIGKTTVNVIVVERQFYRADLLAVSTMFTVMNSGDETKKCKIRFTGFRDANLVSDVIGAFPYVDIGEGSVTKDTDILLIPMEGFSSVKVNKAEKYGVKILPVKTFYQDISKYVQEATSKI